MYFQQSVHIYCHCSADCVVYTIYVYMYNMVCNHEKLLLINSYYRYLPLTCSDAAASC